MDVRRAACRAGLQHDLHDSLIHSLHVDMTAYDVRLRLGRLAAERLDAIEAGLGANAVYMRELEQDLTAARASYVGLAVTEIATLRSQLGGPQLG